jgi:hypothetical protein
MGGTASGSGGGRSQRAVAREFGLARETVRKMLRYAVPPGYQRQQPIKRPKLGPWLGVIDAILEDDKQRPAKQRHTAKRIFERLRKSTGSRRLHDREGLRAVGDAAAAGDVRSADASAGRGAGRLRRSAGGRCRRGAEGALPGDGPAALRRLLRDGVSGRDDGGLSGRPCSSLRLLRRRSHAHSLRQHEDRGGPILGGEERQKTRAFSELQSHYLFADKFGRPAKGNDKGKVEGWWAMRGATSWFRFRA